MPLNIDWQQILLHMLNLVLLLAALYFLLYKPVKKFMDQRAEQYRQMDAQARENLAQSEKTKEEYDHRLEQISRQIEEEKQKAHLETTEAARQRLAQANAQAEQILEKARSDAQREYDKRIAGANDAISEMAAAAAQKLVFADTDEAYNQFLNMVEGSGADE